MILQRTILLLILAVGFALPAVLQSSQSLNPTRTSKEIKILATGPKVSIKSLALNTPNSKRRMTGGGGGGSQLHEIFLTPYRYVSILLPILFSCLSYSLASHIGYHR